MPETVTNTTTMAQSTANPTIGAGNALLTGAGSLLSTGLSAIYNKKEAQRQREWNEAMMEKQNEWSLEQWNRTNEYNSPSAQVRRLRDAGLNPLYYGLDGSSANAFQSAQPLGYERASMSNMQNPVAAGIEGALQMAQLANIEAQTKKTQSETKAIDATLPYDLESLRQSIRNSSLDADGKEIVNKYLDAQQQAELRVKDATVDEKDAMVQKAFAEIDKMDFEKLTMMEGWLKTREEILTLQKNRELTDKQMEELQSLIYRNNQEATKLGLDIKNFDDITVIGSASHTIKVGPLSIAEGEPITLAMQKRIEAQKEALRKEQGERNKNGTDWREKSAYQGPIYD